ncbi:MAG: DUF4291 domain-containing protein [Armatimonas sp.]
MRLILWKPYSEQQARWPKSGKQILAQFDHESIVVYQAYRPEIAAFAVEQQKFGGEFWRDRMTWIKPGFLWMMYRSGWATKSEQERILAIWLRRSDFELFLSEAVASTYHASNLRSRELWQEAVKHSDVRLQWDPDHGPSGGKLERRALQLGLRDKALRRYETSAILEIQDITVQVREQAEKSLSELQTPREDIYPWATETEEE